MAPTRRLTLLTLVLGAVLLWSGWAPRERHTWLLEVAPVLLVLPILWISRRRFPLTPLLTVLIAVHGAILCYGGHYTYARAPLGAWLEHLFGASRNPYDRVGHLAQGFVPAVAAREVLLRLTPLRRGGWLVFLTCCVCLAVSALYELVEWATALISAQAAESFLGTQGDVWDTQWDMFLALCGAVAALVLLSRWHDRQLAGLPGGPDFRTP
jgi:putative membrane protein